MGGFTKAHCSMYKKKIIENRIKRNWTQSQLSEVSRISQPLIAGYESGKNISKRNLQKLADAFGITAEELVSDDPNDPAIFDEVEFAKIINEAKKLPTEHKRRLKDLITVFQTESRLQEERETFAKMITKGKAA